MENELSILIELQKHDNVLDELSEKVISLESSIKQKEVSVEALRQGSKAARESLTALQLKKKQRESDAEAQEKLVKKHQSELNALKTNDAYKAMLSEIEAAKKSQVSIEDDILILMEQIESAEKKLKETESKLKSDESLIKSEIHQLELDKSHLLGDQKDKVALRESFAATVPETVKRQYDNLRRSRAGVAIVAVSNNACTGCHMTIPQSKIVEIKKAKTMVLCESCSRILFLPKDTSDQKSDLSASSPSV